MKISFKQSTSFFPLLAILVFTFFIKLSSIPIRIWDEARNANNAFAMYLHGNWMIPYYEGQPDMWNTKPPFFIWLQTINMHLFGVNHAEIVVVSDGGDDRAVRCQRKRR